MYIVEPEEGALVKISSVPVVHWNPRKYRIPGSQLRVGRRKDNFGDLLGPIIARKIVGSDRDHLLENAASKRTPAGSARRLVAVGSILHMASDNDVIWGTGLNGKVRAEEHTFGRLDVRAIRGPLTAQWLSEKLGVDIPRVFGDPGLLVGNLFPELRNLTKSREMVLIPNLNEVGKYSSHPNFVSPIGDPMAIMRTIASSEYVVGSSLHSIVVAHSLGIASALLKSEAEAPFKYDDYHAGIGYADYSSFVRLDRAIEHAKALSKRTTNVLADWDEDSLLAAFPHDLWEVRD